MINHHDKPVSSGLSYYIQNHTVWLRWWFFQYNVYLAGNSWVAQVGDERPMASDKRRGENTGGVAMDRSEVCRTLDDLNVEEKHIVQNVWWLCW